MATQRKPEPCPPRKPRPTGEAFDPKAARDQAAALYPKVMARLAE